MNDFIMFAMFYAVYAPACIYFINLLGDWIIEFPAMIERLKFIGYK